jgi:hypothetical protein
MVVPLADPLEVDPIPLLWVLGATERPVPEARTGTSPGDERRQYSYR